MGANNTHDLLISDVVIHTSKYLFLTHRNAPKTMMEKIARRAHPEMHTRPPMPPAPGFVVNKNSCHVYAAPYSSIL